MILRDIYLQSSSIVLLGEIYIYRFVERVIIHASGKCVFHLIDDNDYTI